jgi:CDP-diacylglycerol--glycerol-3-phosphate 3-phosphatidyltransferase
MDPLADKLLVMAALIIFVQWGQIPGWAAFVILTREFAVTALRLVAAADGTVIAAGISGKVKTFSSLVCLCLMMTPFHGFALIPPAFTLDVLCVIVMVAVTLWSGAEYFIKYGKLLKVK